MLTGYRPFTQPTKLELNLLLKVDLLIFIGAGTVSKRGSALFYIRVTTRVTRDASHACATSFSTGPGLHVCSQNYMVFTAIYLIIVQFNKHAHVRVIIDESWKF